MNSSHVQKTVSHRDSVLVHIRVLVPVGDVSVSVERRS